MSLSDKQSTSGVHRRRFISLAGVLAGAGLASGKIWAAVAGEEGHPSEQGGPSNETPLNPGGGA